MSRSDVAETNSSTTTCPNVHHICLQASVVLQAFCSAECAASTGLSHICRDCSCLCFHRVASCAVKESDSGVEYLVQGTCKRGDVCPFAHGVFESWLHPGK